MRKTLRINVTKAADFIAAPACACGVQEFLRVIVTTIAEFGDSQWIFVPHAESLGP
jgi:hypothetical protein